MSRENQDHSTAVDLCLEYLRRYEPFEYITAEKVAWLSQEMLEHTVSQSTVLIRLKAKVEKGELMVTKIRSPWIEYHFAFVIKETNSEDE